MINNDVLRSLRYALDLDDAEVLALFEHAGKRVPADQLARFLEREDSPRFEPLPDEHFGAWLDALVTQRRGKREAPAGAAPPPPPPMSNNRVLRSLRIALELTDSDMIEIMDLAGIRISKGEISALFRRADHKNYRECGDQFLRNFLRGLARRNRR